MMRIALSCLVVLASIAIALAQDVKGSSDHPLLPRYEGSEIVVHQVERFADHQLRVSTDRKASLELEGKVTRITYRAPADRSPLEVIRNYETALSAAGFAPIFSCARKKECGDIPGTIETGPRQMAIWGGWDDAVRYVAARKASAEGDVYASVYAVPNHSGGPSRGRTIIQLDVIEMKPMENRMVVVEAAAMNRDLTSSGKVAVYGILFDFDKDGIRPDSKAQLDEIAKLLKDSGGLRVMIAGHTDAKGGVDYNRDLSERRARAVVEALARDYGIERTRLTPVGVGMAAPVASNRTEEGRSLNRRVEVVDLGG